MILDRIALFLKKNLKKGPLILGYSGGFDSKALLYLLLQCKEFINFEILVAHVDHGWREESGREALALKEEILGLKLPFHLKKLEGVFGPNAEGISRQHRFLFFRELSKRYNAQAIVLAHHMDDLAETVLKRFLEGACLTKLKSMKEISYMGGLQVWRPLLQVRRGDILRFLKERGLDAIDDPTNYDRRYLRARMRREIIPKLSEDFGKDVVKNLFFASKRSLELEDYMERRVSEDFKKVSFGEILTYFDFNNLELDKLEMRFLVKKIAYTLSLDISRDSIFRILEAVSFKKSLLLNLKEMDAIVDKGILFFWRRDTFSSFEGVDLKEGTNGLKGFEVHLERSDRGEENSGWKKISDGEIVSFLPKGSYKLVMPKKGDSFFKRSLKKWLYDSKVPPFLRFCFPVIVKEDKIVYEFLSGKNLNSDAYYRVLFRIRG